jgi:hypothetical protein
MRSHVGVAILVSLVCAGCASAHPESVRPTQESVRVVGETGLNIRMSGSDGATTGTVAFTPEKVWSVLPAVYDSLGIPVATVDSKRYLLGNTGFKAYQKLGKTSLAKYIDCGKTQGFPSADSYDVYLQITTQVQPKDAGSTISTLLEAAGRPMAISGDYIKCSSLGALESAILAGVRDRLKG